jgi:YVTN family beta-propeller protein
MKFIVHPYSAVAIVLCAVLSLVAAVTMRAKVTNRKPASSLDRVDPVRTSDQRSPIATGTGSPPSQAPSLFTQRITREGIDVEFSIQHVDKSKTEAKELQEGDDARIRFKITASGRPLRAINPAAWMDLVPKDEIRGAKTCEQKAKAFLGGSIFGRAELDLNVYNVLTLNDEASISVVDPLFGFGGTKLLGMVVLESPGEDWVMTSNEMRIYVSLPDTKKVAVVDTAGWAVSRNIELDRQPGRVALQPDESLLWVADHEAKTGKLEVSGIVAIETTKMERVSRINTGRGHHETAFSDDGSQAFVTNERDDTVSIIDTRSLKKKADIPTGSGPTSVAFSPLAKMAYVSASDGTVTVVDGARRNVVARIKAEPGLGQIRFAPDGRLGFLVNPSRDVVHIIDTATNRIVQTADVEDEPYQVCLSAEFAYVRHRGSENVLMLPLKAVGVEKQPVQVFSFPGGRVPPGTAACLSLPDTIVPAPGESAVLVASPMDKAVSYYKEGMAAPVGNFSNYGRQPRAVLVVDHSLRERVSAGIYESVVRLRKPGDYDVVFFLNSPRIVNCFSATVKPNQALETKRRAGKIKIEHRVGQRRVKVGVAAALRFRLTDEQTSAPLSGLTDVEVLTTLTPNTWHKRHRASPKDDGIYILDFVPPRAGLYYIYLQCLSRGLGFNNNQYLVLEAFDQDEKRESNR